MVFNVGLKRKEMEVLLTCFLRKNSALLCRQKKKMVHEWFIYSVTCRKGQRDKPINAL